MGQEGGKAIITIYAHHLIVCAAYVHVPDLLLRNRASGIGWTDYPLDADR